MRSALPYASRGQVIGLLGGSFDPAHEGHAHITREALKRFHLDQVWWLVSPGNPLKARGPAELKRRLAHAKAVMRHPRVKITDIEAQIGTRYTAETLAVLQKKVPGVQFVWLMGADNLIQFHRWQNWQQIMQSVPVGILARPGDRLAARCSKTARIYRQHKLSGRQSQALGRHWAPQWCFVNMPMSKQSSTQIRAGGNWS